MEKAADPTRERLVRHAREIALIPTLVLVVGLFGVFPEDLPLWVPPAAILAASLGMAWTFTHWAPGTGRERVWPRVVAHTGFLALATYATGWGFALPLIHLFAVADNVRHGSSSDAKAVVRAAVGWTVVWQVLLTFGWAPSMHVDSVVETWAIAAFMLVALAAVGRRVGGVARRLEVVQAEVASSERRFRSLVEDSSDVVLLIRDGVITYESPSTSRVLGYDTDAVHGSSYIEFVHPSDREKVVAQVVDMLADPDESVRIECRLRHADGRWLTVETSARNLTDHREVGGFVVNVRDITERKELEAQLEHRAFHDSLTGLPNRALFRDRVEHLMSRSERRAVTAAVLYLDLDGFKDINDSLGHPVGDAVLVAVGSRIAGAVRASDTAARLGGDEFAVLLEDLEDAADAARAADRVLRTLETPVTVDGVDIHVQASIGVAILDPDQDADDLVRNADIAMYTAKAKGKRGIQVFEPSMHRAVLERLELEQALDEALRDEQFEVHYQPIVSLKNRGVVGFEALVRWRHPERGLVSPMEFIPVAEETGRIVELGGFVLGTAVRQVHEWQQVYPDRDLHLSVNVSMRQLQLTDFVDEVRTVLEETGIDPRSLTLELTESAFVTDAKRTTEMLEKLSELGLQLAIDDFGTGYSSLSYLQQFPLNVLKIDRSFVEGLALGTRSPALVQAIVDMSHGLALRTVAEGIETEDECEHVLQLGCEFGQGWLFARPADAAATTVLLAVNEAERIERAAMPTTATTESV